MLDFGFYNMDCMEGMKQFPDKFFDLAIVDPPYGDAQGGWLTDSENGSIAIRNRGGATRARKECQTTRWELGFPELAESGRRSSEKNHIVGHRPETRIFRRTVSCLTKPDHLGGNYFELPPTRCFLIWRKTNIPEKFTMAMCEYAWTSFNDNAKVFEFSAAGQPNRFHPTQKPIELYEWILFNYAKEGDKILDTHVGSASSLVACRKLNYQFVGFEIDEDYYNLASERLKTEGAQMTIFNTDF